MTSPAANAHEMTFSSHAQYSLLVLSAFVRLISNFSFKLGVEIVPIGLHESPVAFEGTGFDRNNRVNNVRIDRSKVINIPMNWISRIEPRDTRKDRQWIAASIPFYFRNNSTT